MKVLVKALRDDEDFDLRLELVAGASGLSRDIGDPRIQKPGLAFAGLLDVVVPQRIQILGNTELMYIRSLSPAEQRRAVDAFMALGIVCAVVTDNQAIPDALAASAEQLGVPLFRTSHPTVTFIPRAQSFLDEHLSPEMTAHAVLIDVFGVGIMLTGQSGAGKSECALDLVLRGHRLVADDVVILKRRERQLWGEGSPLTRHHMEVRGLGIINVRDLFGAASVCERKRVELIVELLDWTPNLDCDRLGLDEVHEEILDVPVPRLRLPLRPGRNVASIVEVAARNHLLKQQGHHAARELKEKLERHLAVAAKAATDSEED